MWGSLVEFLFKYPPIIFEQGELRLGLSSGLSTAVAIVGAAAASTLLTYTSVKGNRRDRAIFAALRVGALTLVALCLLRPVLVVKAAVPQRNFVGILLDDSRSMRIADDGDKTRGAFVREEFGASGSATIAALSDRFMLRVFRFSSSTQRLAAASDLTFAGTQTHLGQALTAAREELAGLPLAGLVLVTDGADTSQTALTESLLALRADRVPVFTVGVGRETIERDIQVSQISTPRAVLKGASLAVDVLLTQTGFAGARIPLNVETEGRIVGTEEVTLPGDGQPATARVRFMASDAGPHVLRFRVPPQPGEAITQNNAREALIEVEDRREKILYFEGEPRFEVKFIRRAVADDPNLQVVVLQRTAENKYLRLDVDHAEELASGFPRTREDLFAYRGLILGSIEAAAFTPDQLRMIVEFVDRRGGGLLALGGRRAFGEGGYAGTPVADVLPILVEAPAARTEPVLARLNVRPTRAGAAHAVTQIAATERESAARWSALPEVTSVNPVRRAKPGAAVLLTGFDGSGRDQAVLATQRYGRGKALAFTLQDSWIWQLHAEMPVDDATHENFWRQLLRWLVNDVPDRVVITAAADRAEAGQPITLLADVADATWVEVNNARVAATVSGPSGASTDVPMQWTGERNGQYRGTFTPADEGLYEIRVEASRDGVSLGTDASHLRAAPGDDEYFDAAMRAPLLRRIAEETGGRYYARGDVASLAEDLKYTGRGVTVVEERELWDMPALLLLLVGLVLGEWSYRRVRGLA